MPESIKKAQKIVFVFEVGSSSLSLSLSFIYFHSVPDIELTKRNIFFSKYFSNISDFAIFSSLFLPSFHFSWNNFFDTLVVSIDWQISSTFSIFINL